MAMFIIPSCKDCACPYYVNNCSQTDFVKRAKGRKLYPGERYCLNGKRAIRFNRRDSWHRVPSWCPRKRRYPLTRIYTRNSRRDSIYMLMGTKKTVILPTPEDYIFCHLGSVYCTPRQLYLALRSGKEDMQHLLGWYPKQYDVVELDIGVCSYFLFWGDKGWDKLYDFDKARCDTGMIGELFVQPHQESELQHYDANTSVYAENCVGYAEGYFAEGRFRSHWIANRPERKNSSFDDELERLLLVLQSDGFLKNFDAFRSYCYDHIWAMLGDWKSEDSTFGFFVEMKQHTFYLSCIPEEDNSFHVRIYCYAIT